MGPDVHTITTLVLLLLYMPAAGLLSLGQNRTHSSGIYGRRRGYGYIKNSYFVVEFSRLIKHLNTLCNNNLHPIMRVFRPTRKHFSYYFEVFQKFRAKVMEFLKYLYASFRFLFTVRLSVYVNPTAN